MTTYTPIHLHDPVGSVRKLLPLIAEHAPEAERQGKMTDEVYAAIKNAGLFQFMFPKRAGGIGHQLITHTEAVAEMAKADPGSAWAFSLLSSVSASVASMPPSVSQRVYVRGDELCVSVAAPTGTAKPVPGGYEVNGRWGYASGCMHADYALNGVRILDDSGKTIDQGFALVSLKGNPATRIENTWQVAGVCASGSNTVVAENLHIAPELVVNPSALKKMAQEAMDNASPEQRAIMAAAMEPRDRWPMEPLFPLVVLAPMLGCAQSMLEKVTADMKGRAIIGWNFEDKAKSEVFLQLLGQSAMEIDSAWMHIRRAVSDIDETAQGRPLSGFEKARIQADCGHAMGLLRRAGERLMEVAGPSAFSASSPLQRLWRDLNVGSRHTFLNCQLGEELYGRALTGGESSMANLADISA